MLTTNCNLKCLGCMHSCDREKIPYYIDINDLTKQLIIIKNNNFKSDNKPIRAIHFTGGDPLTHPDFIKICELTRQILPDFEIGVSTNGILMNKFTDEQLIYLYKTLKISFQITLYPSLPLLKMYKQLKQRLSSLDLNFPYICSSHLFFSKQEKTINTWLPIREYNNNCYNYIYNKKDIILFKDKFYSCWKDICILQKENHISTESINIYNTYKNQELLNTKEHDLCEICSRHNGSGGLEYILWTHHFKDADIVFNNNLKELYLNYYDIYYKLEHEMKDKLEVFKDPFFKEHLSDTELFYINTRFINGKGDIFIPFNDYLNREFESLLINNIKDLKDYNLYFISFTTNKKIEEQIYQIFLPFNGNFTYNSYFLKASSLYSAYKTFLQNSYLKNKFFIEFNNGQLLLKPLGVNNE